jgi:apolipoprotein N-acyltransferase
VLPILLASILLILAFPNYSIWPAAWLAFVPMFYLLRRIKSSFLAFLCFYVLGFIFFFATCEWLRHVTYFGWVFVSCLYAFYFGVFGWVSHWGLKRGNSILLLLLIPSAWTVLEWVRAELPTWGFGWNLLAYSQAPMLPVAKLAAMIGGFGVSWTLMLGNLAFFFLVSPLVHRFLKKDNISAKEHTWQPLGAMAGVSVIAFLFAGHSFLSGQQTSENVSNENIQVAVIQANIPQEEKWDPSQKGKIIGRYEALTQFVASEQPELIVWPEAAFPGFLNQDQAQDRIFKLQTDLGASLLLGSPHLESEKTAFNSVYLVEEGMIQNRYDKVRLVPFGEFVPWKPIFGMLGLLPLADQLGVGDYKSGKGIDVFTLKSGARLSPLICFEDTVPSLARQAVKKGAQFLVVMTNDGWFSRSAAPHQHLQASIFRAIENRVPVIRAANTGVSAFIGRGGEVLDRIRDQFGHDIFVMGGLVRSVSMAQTKTPYQEAGYLMPIFCFALVCVSAILIQLLWRPEK